MPPPALGDSPTACEQSARLPIVLLVKIAHRRLVKVNELRLSHISNERCEKCPCPYTRERSRYMSKWIKLTRPDGQPIYVNIEAAVSVTALSPSSSRVAFSGSAKDFVDVKETPEAILAEPSYR